MSKKEIANGCPFTIIVKHVGLLENCQCPKDHQKFRPTGKRITFLFGLKVHEEDKL